MSRRVDGLEWMMRNPQHRENPQTAAIFGGQRCAFETCRSKRRSGNSRTRAESQKASRSVSTTSTPAVQQGLHHVEPPDHQRAVARLEPVHSQRLAARHAGLHRRVGLVVGGRDMHRPRDAGCAIVAQPQIEHAQKTPVDGRENDVAGSGGLVAAPVRSHVKRGPTGLLRMSTGDRPRCMLGASSAMPTVPLPFVHVGYHRTATTWLQDRFFPLLGDRIALFGLGTLWPALMAPSPLVFDRRHCRRRFAALQLGQAGRLCVFSAERLSGNPYSGGYDAAEIAGRIKAAFGDARILIVVREQVSMLVSVYKRHVSVGGAWTLDECLTPRPELRFPRFRLSNYRYHHLVEHYVRLFGDRRVLVLPYELLLRDRDLFLGRVTEHMGLSGDFTVPAGIGDQRENASPSDFYVRLLRRVNLLSGATWTSPLRPRAPSGFRLRRSAGPCAAPPPRGRGCRRRRAQARRAVPRARRRRGRETIT